MSAFNTKLFRMIGLLFIILTLLASNARAALPDAGTEIGTKAVVQFTIDGAEEESVSNIVTTTIAQVYATKIETLNGATGKAGEDVDIRFSVRNVGNGADDVKLTLSTDVPSITKFILMTADDNGKADESSQQDTNMKAEFGSSNIKRDQLRHFVARVAVPKGAAEELKFKITATNNSKTSTDATVSVKIVDGKAFIVEPVGDVKLDNAKKALVEFKVKSGSDASDGYFELIVTKKSEIATPVAFNVVNKAILFADKPVAGTAISVNEAAKTTELAIKDIAANSHSLMTMNIEIPGAERGDEYVMYVRHAKSKEEAVKTPSTGIQITYVHEMLAPALKVTGNNADKAKAPFDKIDAAVSGETVEYTMTLTNNSSRAENFTLEMANKADGIDKMWLFDGKGNQFGTASGRGLPETGLIKSGDKVTIKFRAALKHGISAALGEQKLSLTVKSITEATAAALVQNFSIAKVVLVDKPVIKFFSDAERKKEIKASALDVPGKDDAATYYMEIAAPQQAGDAMREYQINFDTSDTKITHVGESTLNATQAILANAGHGNKAAQFFVQTTMRGLAELTAKVAVFDVRSGQVQNGSIVLKKGVSIGFTETGYNGKGAPDMDTDLTVVIKSDGRAINDEEFEIYAPENPTFGFLFSVNGETWNKVLPLPQIAAQGQQAVQVKIRVPKNVKAGAIESLKLALRKKGTEVVNATVSVTLNINKSKLGIEKFVAVVKKGSKALPTDADFVQHSTQKVESGDTIWYRVVVTNPISAPVAKNVKIIDDLPKYVTFAKSRASGQQAKLEDGKVTMIISDEMNPGATATMEYSVTVDLGK